MARASLWSYRRSGKRLLDLLLLLLSLPFALLLLSLVALLVLIADGSPVLFTQQRSGRKERWFRLYKFRTMRPARQSNPAPSAEAARITRSGRFLRASGLDELPQLWNVLRGEMSFVGPRPLLPEYSRYYRPQEKIRFLVKPGITGLAQVNERNTTTWCRRLQQDAYYARHCSLALDLRILGKTLRNFFRVKAQKNRDIMPRLDVERSSDR